jgi:hypothetical protein
MVANRQHCAPETLWSFSDGSSSCIWVKLVSNGVDRVHGGSLTDDLRYLAHTSPDPGTLLVALSTTSIL